MKNNSILVDERFCTRLNDLILKRHMNRSVVAQRADVSHRIVYKMLTVGETIRRVTLVKVAEALGVSDGYLETGIEDDPAEPEKPGYPEAASTLTHVREDASKQAYGHEMTLSDAVTVIAKQTGTDEKRVLQMISDLVLGNERRRP